MKTARGPALLSLLMLALASGCTGTAANADAGADAGDPGPFADIWWRVRCQTMGMCVETPARSILGFDGERGQRISCNVVETATERTLSFATHASAGDTPFGLALDATFPRGGGDPVPGCEVSVVEGSDTLVGACGAAPPSEAQTCQVTNVIFGDDGEGRTLIRGEIHCVGISPSAVPTIDREVTSPAEEGGAEPLGFNVYECVGFTGP